MDLFLTQPEPQGAAEKAARKRTADFFISLDDVMKLLWVQRPSSAPMVTAEPTSLRAQLRAPFNGVLQQDAEEFLLYILDRLETDAGYAPTLAWQSVFLGETTSTTKCSRCDKPPTTIREQFLNLKLSVPLNPSPEKKFWLNLERLILDNYLPKELLTGANRFDCTNCKLKTDAERSTALSVLPPVLIITLSRFDMAAGKIMTSVPFHRQMVFSGVTYDFAGMIMHKGATQNSGHYISYVRSPQFPGNSNWFRVNDSIVTPMTDREIDILCVAFKPTSDETPYILAFNRRV
jgi:ubiquitin C-terminal hydrolase